MAGPLDAIRAASRFACFEEIRRIREGKDLGIGGVISGTPASPGTSSVTLQVADTSSHTATASFTLTISGATTITAYNNSSGTAWAGIAIWLDGYPNGGSACTTPCTLADGLAHSIQMPSPGTFPQGGAGSEAVFNSWSDGGANPHTIQAGASVTAGFNSQGVVVPSGFSANGWYPAGTSFWVTAQANSGFGFITLSNGYRQQAVAMNSAVTVTANFSNNIFTVRTSPQPRMGQGQGVTAQYEGSSTSTIGTSWQSTLGSFSCYSVTEQISAAIANAFASGGDLSFDAEFLSSPSAAPGPYDVTCSCAYFECFVDWGPVGVMPTNPWVSALSYSSDTGYQDATSSTIYVSLGSTVTFQATPSSGSFPSGSPTWGGSSGASGSGSSASVTFNSVSSSTTNYKIVTVTCGNTLTANVIVFDLSAVLTPADNFDGRSLSDFGVGETIELSFTTTPSVTAAQAGGLEWVVMTQGGELTDNGDGTGSFDVPDAVGSFTLALQIKGGASKGATKQQSAGIVAPTGAYQTLVPGYTIYHRNGAWSIGHLDYTYPTPKNVSFLNIVTREAGGTATATGVLSGLNGASHPNWPSMKTSNCNAQMGCQASTDTIHLTDQVCPCGPGQVTWPIARLYKRAKDLDSSYKPFATLTFTDSSDLAGTAVSAKGGAGPFAKYASDPKSCNPSNFREVLWQHVRATRSYTDRLGRSSGAPRRPRRRP